MILLFDQIYINKGSNQIDLTNSESEQLSLTTNVGKV